MSALTFDPWQGIKTQSGAAPAARAANPANPVFEAASHAQAEAERQDSAAARGVDANPRGRGIAEHQAPAAYLRGLQRAALQRPPAWSDASRNPTPGAWCSCCEGSLWWREAQAPRGWRCARCHPSIHLAPAAVVEVGE